MFFGHGRNLLVLALWSVATLIPFSSNSQNLPPSLDFIEVENLGFSYSGLVGDGTVDTFVVNQDDYTQGQSANFNVAKQGTEFVLSFLGDEFRLKNAPELLLNAENAEVDNLNLIYDTANRGKLSAKRMDFVQADQSYVKIDDFVLDCEADKGLLEDLFARCFSSGHISIASLKNKGIEGGETEFRAINMTTSNGNFRVKLRLNSPQFKGKIEIKGTIKYDAGSQMVVAYVKEARTGILNIKNQLFKQLKAYSGENLIVENPYLKMKL